MEFLNSLKNRSKHYDFPFKHWELNQPLTEEAINEICKAEIIDLKKFRHLAIYHGTYIYQAQAMCSAVII